MNVLSGRRGSAFTPAAAATWSPLNLGGGGGGGGGGFGGKPGGSPSPELRAVYPQAERHI